MDVHVSLVGRTDLAAEIYRQLRQAILDGRLRPNDRLPPTREMAKRLSVSRTTVTVAYDRLSAAGYLTARVGAGTYVREHVAVRPGEGGGSSDGDALRARPVWASVGLSHAFDRPARYDFRSGLPDASLFPFATWRRLVSRETRVTVPGAGVYGAAAGDEGLRAAIARHVGVSRGVEALSGKARGLT